MVQGSERVYAIKAEVSELRAESFAFLDRETMYGGRKTATGDTIFVFASENEGGTGLVACGIVALALPTPPKPGIERQTPRVSIAVRCTALAKRRLGRSELKPLSDWSDDRPKTELNSKLYRQAPDQIVGISEEAAALLQGFF